MALGPNRSASMSSGLLLDPMSSSNGEQTSGGPRFRPYASPNHHVTKGRYITSNDPRGYIPVYEYPLNGQWIMLDMDDGYVLWTGIWKALGNNKADIVKIIDSQPDLASQLRRVRGGYLKIQGTWMPYEIALRLARRVAWPIRHDLVPLFGPTFPSTCLSPDQPGYGQIVSPGTGKRRARRNTQAELSTDPRHGWTVISPLPGPLDSVEPALVTSSAFHQQSPYSNPASHGPLVTQVDSPVMLHVPYVDSSHRTQAAAGSSFTSQRQTNTRRKSPPSDSGSVIRYSPYPPSPLSSRPGSGYENSHAAHSVSITLPSIQPQRRGSLHAGAVTLPPITAMDARREEGYDDSMAVLRRLQSDDKDLSLTSADERFSSQRRYTIPDPAYRLSDAFFTGGREPTTNASSRSSSASTHSPPLSSSTHDSPSTTDVSSAKSTSITSLAPSWERHKMPPPPSPRGSTLSRELLDYQLNADRSHFDATPQDRTADPEKRAWRPW